MNILITGGSSFIGKHLKPYLLDKHKIWSPSRKELNLLDEHAVSNYLSNKNFDLVIHIATEPDNRSIENPGNVLENNLRMYFNLVNANDYFKKMITFSSGAIYKPVNFSIPEYFFGFHVPKDAYGFSKYIMSQYNSNNINVTELRLFGIFGPYENYGIRFISNAICKTIFGLPITIKQDRAMSYLWIKDLLPILDNFIGKQYSGAYNITSNYTYHLTDLANIILQISGKHVPIIIDNNNDAIPYIGDNSKLLTYFPNTRFTDMDIAIEQLYRWYYNNKGNINKELLLIDK